MEAVVSQLITMILLMIIGGLLYRYEYVNEVSARGLSVVLSRVAVPCNMIILMQREFSRELLLQFIQTITATFAILFLASALFFVVARGLQMNSKEQGLFMVAGAYSNVIFMGQPLILAMYQEEGLFFCVAIMFACNFFMCSFGAVFFQLGSEEKESFQTKCRNIFCNGLFLSAVVAILLFVFGISLPTPLYGAFSYVANTSVPLSMIYIGTLLASANLKMVLQNKRIFLFSVLSLLVLPVLTKITMTPFLSGMPLDILVVLMATPAAAALPSFAQLYGNDAKSASEYVFVSTVLSVFTLPLVITYLVV